MWEFLGGGKTWRGGLAAGQATAGRALVGRTWKAGRDALDDLALAALRGGVRGRALVG
jgi:hypothetical protein